MRKVYTPRSYQDAITEHIVANPRCNVWGGMGCGKSVATLTALDALYHGMGETEPTLVLAPLRVAQSTWPDEAKKWAHLSRLEVVAATGDAKERAAALKRDVPVFTINYDLVPWLVDFFGDRWPFKTIIADECFVAGTKVSTQQGLKDIESITPGEEVLTMNGPRKVTHVFKKKAKALVRLHLSDGREIVTTPTHRFWTEGGWRESQHLAGYTTLRHPGVQELRKELRNQGEQIGVPDARAVLRQVVLNEALGRKEAEGVLCERGAVVGATRCGERGLERRGTDAGIHEGVAVCQSKSSGRRVQQNARRKRNRDELPRATPEQDSQTGVGVELPSANEAAGDDWLAFVLQAGFRLAGGEGVHRGGREHPSDAARTDSQSEEDRGFGSARVDRVEVVEHGSGTPVWDLEVEGEHHYFADGALVHNCTRLKSFRITQGGKRAAYLGALAHTKIERWVNLTGTPAPNGLVDLWGQTWFVDEGQRLGKSFSAFEARWFAWARRNTKDQYAKDRVLQEGAQKQIEERLRDVTITVRAADFMDLPPLIENVIEVEMPASARRHYRELQRELFTRLADGVEVEAFNAASLSMKCLQCANGAIYLDPEKFPPKDGEPVWIEVHDAKLQALESVIEEAAGAPVLVAYHFKSDLARLQRAFPQGRQLDADPRTITDWNAGNIPLLFAHPASAGHGLNLQDGGNILVFFGLWWDLEQHEQIIERIGPTRQAQSGHNRPVFVHRIVTRGTVDELVLARLRTKASVQSLLLDAMKGNQ